MYRRTLCVLALVAALPACNASRETFFLERLRGDVPGYSVDAKQRFVWHPTTMVRVPKTEGVAAGENTYGYEPRRIICAEPSPDALSALASQLSARLNVSVPQGPGGAAALERSITETVRSLTDRTEMIQLLRDGYYRACEGYANGMIGEFGYGLILNQLDDLMLRMAAMQVLAQQRPLPEGEGDRAKISDAEVAYIEFRDAAAALTAATAARDGLEMSVRRARERIAHMRAEPNGETLNAAAIQRENAIIQAWIAEIPTAQARISTLEGTYTQAGTDYRKALAAAAAVHRGPLPVHALMAIRDLAMEPGTTDKSTIAGACMMWLSQRLDIPEKSVDGEPLFVAACRRAMAGTGAPSYASWTVPGVFAEELRK